MLQIKRCSFGVLSLKIPTTFHSVSNEFKVWVRTKQSIAFVNGREFIPFEVFFTRNYFNRMTTRSHQRQRNKSNADDENSAEGAASNTGSEAGNKRAARESNQETVFQCKRGRWQRIEVAHVFDHPMGLLYFVRQHSHPFY